MERLLIFRGFLGYFGQIYHRIDKGVHRFLAFGLGRLNHQGLFYNQREVNGRRMEARVNQAFGDIEGVDAVLILARCAEDAFVLAQLRVGQVVIRF